MKQAHKPDILAERTQHTAGLFLCYRLEFAKGFWISVACGEEITRAFLGSDMESAWATFRSCVLGCVTPCTVLDICEDLFYLQTVNPEQDWKKTEKLFTSI